MSTMLISKNVIDYVLSAAMALGPCGRNPDANLPPYLQENDWREPERKPFDKMGQAIHKRNVESFRYVYADRHNDAIGTDTYTFAKWPLKKFECFDPVQVLKSIEFCKYQMDDDGKLKESLPGEFFDWLRDMYIYELPGWNDHYEWGAPEPTATKTRAKT